VSTQSLAAKATRLIGKETLKKRMSKKTLLYAAYIIGITVIFLYYLFPSEAVRDYVVYKMTRGNPDVSVTIDRVSPVLPPGIKLHDVGIAHGNRAIVDLDSVKITPGLLSVFSSKKTARFKGRVNGGTVNGWAEVDSRKNQQAEKIEGTISGIQVQGIAALKHLDAYKISGNLGGDFTIGATGSRRSMTGKLTLSECRIDFDQPIIGLSSLRFQNINADLVLNKGTLAIKKFSARGNDLNVDISGTIALNRSGRGNTLNLNGSVTPHHGFLAKIGNNIPAGLLHQKKAGKTTISFRIGGTLEAPDFRLN
jgi:type II secretion system protein N